MISAGRMWSGRQTSGTASCASARGATPSRWNRWAVRAAPSKPATLISDRTIKGWLRFAHAASYQRRLPGQARGWRGLVLRRHPTRLAGPNT